MLDIKCMIFSSFEPTSNCSRFDVLAGRQDPESHRFGIEFDRGTRVEAAHCRSDALKRSYSHPSSLAIKSPMKTNVVWVAPLSYFTCELPANALALVSLPSMRQWAQEAFRELMYYFISIGIRMTEHPLQEIEEVSVI